jgi:hypothetical protein
VPSTKYRGKYISSNVIMSGKADAEMEVPVAIEWKCHGALDSDVCAACRKKDKEEGMWTLTRDNLEDVVRIVDVASEAIKKRNMHTVCGIPTKCPNGTIKPIAFEQVQKCIFTPDVESESAEDFHEATAHAYVIGKSLEDGQRYRAYFKRFAHEDQQQRIVLGVDRTDQSDNPINSFVMKPEIMEQLKVFQGNPFDVMEDRAERVKDIRKEFSPKEVIWATDLMYHSPISFRFEESQTRGYPEIIIAGESRTGKTKTARELQKFYGIGNILYGKTASEVGLMGGAHQSNGRWMLEWGSIPMNHKGLLIIDEVSGLGKEKISKLTAVRSEGYVDIKKIVKGKAPAQTRLLWISNPNRNGQSKNVHDYNDGVRLLMDLIGSDEDVARFDLAMITTRQPTVRYRKEDIELFAHDRQVYRNLIYWCWTRTVDQVIFDDYVEDYIWQRSDVLNEKYDCEGVKLFGVELRFKLARLAAAVAGCCFSTNSTGDLLVIKKEHVDWAESFLVQCYDNDTFNIQRYVLQQRRYNEVDQNAINRAHALCEKNPAMAKALINNDSFSLYDLQAVSGLENDEAKKYVHALIGLDFIKSNESNRYESTLRFRKAVKIYNQTVDEHRMRSLNEKGGFI